MAPTTLRTYSSAMGPAIVAASRSRVHPAVRSASANVGLRTASSHSPLQRHLKSCMPRAAGRAGTACAAQGVTNEVETLGDGSAVETFTLDIGGPQPIVQKMERKAGTQLVALEVSRDGGMGMVLEESVEKTADGKPAPRVKVLDSRSADRSKYEGDAPMQAGAGPSTVVVEVVPGSNAEAAGVKEGDKIRFFTAVFTVSDPIDILSYYGNPPKKENRRGVYVADGQPFDKTMAALASNAQPHVTEKEGVLEVADTVLLVVERSA